MLADNVNLRQLRRTYTANIIVCPCRTMLDIEIFPEMPMPRTRIKDKHFDPVFLG